MSRGKKILWISRHNPDGWTSELHRVFGRDVQVHWDRCSIDRREGVRDVQGRMRSGQFDELVLVAPISITGELAEKGLSPIRPLWDRERNRPLRLERIQAVRKEFREVEASATVGRRVMWHSQFPTTDRQAAELQRLFGDDVDIVHDSNRNAEKAVANFRRGQYDAMVVIVPMAVFERLSAIDPKLPFLWSEAVKENDPSRIEFRGSGGQGFRFDRFRWISIKVEAETL